MSGEKWVERLRGAVQGQLLLPEDQGYDTARQVWNAMIDRRPAAILHCVCADDVVVAVKTAVAYGLAVSVRGGGHNVAGTAVSDGGLMIDLSSLRSVQVDAKRQRAWVEGGATLRDLDAATQAQGLATPGGVVSSTGVAGLTLGGGFGWLSRLHGLTSDNLLSVELVLADGSQVRASAEDHSDLFWGLRGGSGNFGIATKFEFALHPIGPEILFGPTVYPLEDAPAVLRHYEAFALEAPRSCCVWANLMTAPPLPFLPEEFHGSKVLTLMQCCAGDPEEGRRLLAPLRKFSTPLGDAVMPRPYTEAQSILDAAYDKGARNYWRSHNFLRLEDPLPDTLCELAADLPTPESDILISQLGGAIADRAPGDSAYPHRQTNFAITPGVRWRDPAEDEARIAWLRTASDALAAQAEAGSYVNFISEREGRAQEAYGANYGRLTALKAEYDPENLFRCNQNVVPA
ncbi:FAD-binding oxidoreductase [Pelagibius sp. Alg239-R121]|uniref:FAD-binding oxidoreductase n=1 Tax=Pelagibius sp. Alg239-R121 TaxID=2993448 RepID=UPI0024A6B70C|nr:FAD-binding oxidoreductase [Pelagibius sp. Alg239-R121]